MAICKFKALYNDPEDVEKIKLWTCDQESSSNQYCCFHDKTDQQWDNLTFEKFRKMIMFHEKTEKLFLIGYFFPDNISFKLLLPLDPNPLKEERTLMMMSVIHANAFVNSQYIYVMLNLMDKSNFHIVNLTKHLIY